jgi:hypothetical protein
MFKHKSVPTITLLLVALAMVFSACAPAAPAASAKPLSFTAKTYTNSDYGFTVQYPSDWADLKFRAPTIFYVGSPMQVPVLSISVYDTGNFKSQIEAQLTDRSKASKYVWSDPTPVTLADGKTKGNYLTCDYEIPGVPLKTLWLTVDRSGGKTMTFAWTTITTSFDIDQFKEYMSTVAFK